MNNPFLIRDMYFPSNSLAMIATNSMFYISIFSMLLLSVACATNYSLELSYTSSLLSLGSKVLIAFSMLFGSFFIFLVEVLDKFEKRSRVDEALNNFHDWRPSIKVTFFMVVSIICSITSLIVVNHG
jgi:fumarate reductase subunit D